jgi:hypothetical protein
MTLIWSDPSIDLDLQFCQVLSGGYCLALVLFFPNTGNTETVSVSMPEYGFKVSDLFVLSVHNNSRFSASYTLEITIASGPSPPPPPPPPGSGGVTMDFESPSLGFNQQLIIDPFDAGSVIFTAEPAPTGEQGIIGLVKNTGDMSACVPPESSNQLLATGPKATTQRLGRSGWWFRATFRNKLPAGAIISALVQVVAQDSRSPGGVSGRIRLLTNSGAEVGSASRILSVIGLCPGNTTVLRGSTTVAVTATAPADYAIISVEPGNIFVIDNFTIR